MQELLNELKNRFRIEPRTNYEGNRRWLVCFDKLAGDYLKEPGNSRKYKKFSDSDEMIDYIISSGLIS